MMSLTAFCFNGYCPVFLGSFFLISLSRLSYFLPVYWGKSRHILDVALAHSRPVAHASIGRFLSFVVFWISYSGVSSDFLTDLASERALFFWYAFCFWNFSSWLEYLYVLVFSLSFSGFTANIGVAGGAGSALGSGGSSSQQQTDSTGFPSPISVDDDGTELFWVHWKWTVHGQMGSGKDGNGMNGWRW